MKITFLGTAAIGYPLVFCNCQNCQNARKYGNVDYSFSHLNTKLFIEQLSKMKQLNIINETTKIYGTHISHDGMPYHELA